jgi:hypothetical protein
MEKSRAAALFVWLLFLILALSFCTLKRRQSTLLRRVGHSLNIFPPLISEEKYYTIDSDHHLDVLGAQVQASADSRDGNNTGILSTPVSTTTVLAKSHPDERNTGSVSLRFVKGGTRKILGKGWNLLSFSSNKLEYTDDQGWLHVRYRAGSFGGSGGLVFDSQPFRGGFETMTVTYSLWVPTWFVWNKGGKLPGLYGGNSR